MTWNHLFIIDPLETLHPHLDSSLRMMLSLAKRDHKIFVSHTQDLFLEYQTKWGLTKGSGMRYALCRELSKNPHASYQEPLFTTLNQTSRPLHFFNAIHMRKDPPFDMNYISSTWLLDKVPEPTKIYNHPSALRDSNEKILIADFPDCIAPLLVTSNVQKIIEFIREYHDVILKPLDLFGGRGVKRIVSRDLNDADLIQLLTEETENNQRLRLVQPFNHNIAQGEIRVFTAFGEPIAWCLKKPQPGKFLANTRAGATLHSVKPSVKLDAMVRKIAAKLGEKGIQLIGFDIIGELISEINITSPRVLIPDESNIQETYDRFAELCENNLRF